MHVNSELLNTAAGAVSAVALVFIGGWENERRTWKAEARRDAAADRAALEAQADELVTAVLALKVVGNTHDHLWGGWGAKGRVVLRALTQGGTAALVSGRRGVAALPALLEEAGRVVERWDSDSAISAAGLAAPLSRLGAAVAPLLRSDVPGLAAAADEVFMAAVESYGDEARMTRALEAFHAAVRPALAQSNPAHRRWPLWRRRRASVE
ncbi:hypothetical protein ACFYWH_20070 [Streptomyces sp. NPDC003737]|uniref:hypothetical protein n=1 Tax=Streptomyces sp. NPDC003737 TaxID=3364685 RepID=UPI00368FDF2C